MFLRRVFFLIANYEVSCCLVYQIAVQDIPNQIIRFMLIYSAQKRKRIHANLTGDLSFTRTRNLLVI